MIKSINSQELKNKIDNGEEIVLVDCREQGEWDDAHISQAKFLPLSDFKNGFKELNPSATIIMQCRSGKRSMTACQILLENKFENITNLEDGIIGWVNNGYEVTK